MLTALSSLIFFVIYPYRPSLQEELLGCILAPVISASIHRYVNYFDIQVLMMVTETETLTSTLHRNKFTYLDYVFLLPPHTHTHTHTHTYIYIYIVIFATKVGCSSQRIFFILISSS